MLWNACPSQDTPPPPFFILFKEPSCFAALLSHFGCRNLSFLTLPKRTLTARQPPPQKKKTCESLCWSFFHIIITSPLFWGFSCLSPGLWQPPCGFHPRHDWHLLLIADRLLGLQTIPFRAFRVSSVRRCCTVVLHLAGSLVSASSWGRGTEYLEEF